MKQSLNGSTGTLLTMDPAILPVIIQSGSHTHLWNRVHSGMEYQKGIMIVISWWLVFLPVSLLIRLPGYNEFDFTKPDTITQFFPYEV